MATSTFDSTKLHLSELLADVRSGKLQLPEFQRGWVWDDAHIRDLITSVSLGFPIGAVMLLQTGGDVRFKARPVEGVDVVEHEPERLILDGQQRLTSLFQSLYSGRHVATHDHRNRRLDRWYYLDVRKALEAADRVDAVRSIPADRQVRDNFGRDIVEDYSTPDKEYQALIFPLTQVFDSARWRTEMQAHHDYKRDVIETWNGFEQQVLDNFKSYQLPVITLKKETQREAVCLVFEKVNTGGVALTVFELLTASFAAEQEGFNLRDDWAEKHHRMVEGTNQPRNRSVLSNVSPTDFLQGIALLKSYERRTRAVQAGHTEDRIPAVSCKRRDVLRLTKADYDQWGDLLIKSFVEAARFLHGEKVFEVKFIPYATQLVPLAAILAVLGHLAQDAGPRDKIRRWYWCGVFGELYGAATETRFANDLVEVVNWIEGGGHPRTVAEANLSPERLERLRTRNSAAYRGLYVLLLREGATDWRTGETADIQNYYDEAIDIHHVFPRKWCTDRNLPRERYDSVINKTPLTARTNRIIRDRAPSSYLRLIADKADLDDGTLDRLLETHVIDARHLRGDDFRGLWNQRRDDLLQRVSTVMGKALVSDATDATSYEPLEADDEDD